MPRTELTLKERDTLLAIAGLDLDPGAIRRELIAGPSRARRAEILLMLERHRARELWRPRAEVEALVGPGAVAEAIDAGLAEEWAHDDGPQLVPTPRGVEGLGLATAERSRVDYRPAGDDGPAETIEAMLERVFYAGEGVAGNDEPIFILWGEGAEPAAPPRRRAVPDQVIEEVDYWDFPGPAERARPRIPTRRGIYPMIDEFAAEAVAPGMGPAEEAIERAEPTQRVTIRVFGRPVEVDKGSRLAELAGRLAEAGPSELRGGLGAEARRTA